MPGRRVLKQFENLHPRLLQWDVDYKIASLRSTKFKGFWAIERKEWIGEIILSWENCDNIVHVDSIGVIESATGKGIGTSLTLRALEWAKEKGFEYYTGYARVGSSWNIVKRLGAKKIYDCKNWSGTGETYVHFKLKIK